MAEDFDVDAWLDGYQPRFTKVRVCQRADLLGEHERLELDLVKAGQDGDTKRAETIAAAMLEVEAEVEASQAEFKFRSLPHEGTPDEPGWYDLIADHPASDADRVKNPGAVVSPEFQLHAIAHCSVAPKLTVEQVRKLRRKLRPDDFDRVWIAVSEANEGAVVAPKSGLATGVIRLFEKSSTTSGRAGSRGRSSTGGGAARSKKRTTTQKAG